MIKMKICVECKEIIELLLPGSYKHICIKCTAILKVKYEPLINEMHGIINNETRLMNWVKSMKLIMLSGEYDNLITQLITHINKEYNQLPRIKLDD